MFRVIVCGSRDFSDEAHLADVMDRVLAKHPDLLIIQGGAKGADSLAHQWAANTGVPQETFLANWDLYGKRAGYLRNVQMADSGADAVIAFFRDNAEPSKGTSMMLDLARQRGIRTWVPPMPAYQF